MLARGSTDDGANAVAAPTMAAAITTDRSIMEFVTRSFSTKGDQKGSNFKGLVNFCKVKRGFKCQNGGCAKKDQGPARKTKHFRLWRILALVDPPNMEGGNLLVRTGL